MGLLDSIYFGHKADFGGETGGLLDLLRRSQTQQEQYQPSAGFGQPEQATPLNVGGYQMPRIGTAAQFTPPPSDPAALPPNAQPTQGQMPPEQGGIGGFLSSLNENFQSMGNGGSIIGALTGQRPNSQTAQFLTSKGIDPALAKTIVSDPQLLRAVLPQVMGTAKQYGFQKMDDGTLVRTDPTKGTAEVAFGGNEANRTGVAGPDGKIIPYPEGLDAAGRKTFANEIARINADAAGGKKTEVQAKSEKFANLMEVAEKNLKDIQGEGTSLRGKTLESLPGGVGNYGQSNNFQKYTQAKNKFITSLLRDESGAAIGTEEFKRYERELFPQPGDGPEVIAQKAENRKAAVDAMKKSAGPGYKAPEGAQPQTAPAKVRKYNPATGTIE